MQTINTITIVHVMASMCGIHKLDVCYLEHRRWMCVEVSTILPVQTLRM